MIVKIDGNKLSDSNHSVNILTYYSLFVNIVKKIDISYYSYTIETL